VSQALGMSQYAGYQISIFRKKSSTAGQNNPEKITVDVDRLLNGGDISQDIELQNADVIYVPKSVFYIYGEVNRPGAYRLEKGITVKKAIALSGGLTPKGSPRRIETTRKGTEVEETRSSEIDSYVQSDDVINIKESLF